MFHAYQVEIPAGWRALLPFFYPTRAAHDGSGSQDNPDPLTAGYVQLRAGVLLCRQETDDQAALQEFSAGIVPEAAFLDQDGQYLQASQGRPAFGVLPLEAPSAMCPDRVQGAECLVLLPCVALHGGPDTTYPEPRLFVDGHEVYCPRPPKSKEAA